MNTQRQQPIVLSNKILVHSIFETIQGEGPFQGYPATFIRLAGCNLQCPACDTEYTLGAKEMSVEEIVYEGIYAPDHIVVITGGEPFRQDLTNLIQTLLREGFIVQIETNGTIEIPKELLHWGWNLSLENLHIVCSPKTPNIADTIKEYASCFKYIIDYRYADPDDGLPGNSVLGYNHKKKIYRQNQKDKKEIYIIPQDDDNYRQNVDSCIRSAKAFGYRMQLQIHKIIGVE